MPGGGFGLQAAKDEEIARLNKLLRDTQETTRAVILGLTQEVQRLSGDDTAIKAAATAGLVDPAGDSDDDDAPEAGVTDTAPSPLEPTAEASPDTSTEVKPTAAAADSESGESGGGGGGGGGGGAAKKKKKKNKKKKNNCPQSTPTLADPGQADPADVALTPDSQTAAAASTTVGDALERSRAKRNSVELKLSSDGTASKHSDAIARAQARRAAPAAAAAAVAAGGAPEGHPEPISLSQVKQSSVSLSQEKQDRYDRVQRMVDEEPRMKAVSPPPHTHTPRVPTPPIPPACAHAPHTLHTHNTHTYLPRWPCFPFLFYAPEPPFLPSPPRARASPGFCPIALLLVG